MRVGFIITAPYQVFHYREIARHFDHVTAFLEAREDDFGLTSGFVREHFPSAQIKWVHTSRLRSIDGECDVLVCQTPVPALQFFERSRLVAQQYSLAKQTYQYGLWRAQADGNLLYGLDAVGKVSPFASAVATGNPLLDAVWPDSLPDAPKPLVGEIRLLYMPTYGDLSDKASGLEKLLATGCQVAVKPHHADLELKKLAKDLGAQLLPTDAHPLAPMMDADVVVSDYSGAVYDALALRKPVILTADLNRESEAIPRLAAQEMNSGDILRLTVRWEEGMNFEQACEQAVAALASDEDYAAYLKRNFVNLGNAGLACAEAIKRVGEFDRDLNFSQQQVRDTARRYVEEMRLLRQKLRKCEQVPFGGVTEGIRQFVRQPKWPTLLTLVRRLILKLPRGQRLLSGLRRIRALWHAPTALQVMERARVSEAAGEGGLPRVPWARRKALADQVGPLLREAGIDLFRSDSHGLIALAIKQEELDKFVRAIKRIARQPEFRSLEVYRIANNKVRYCGPANSMSMNLVSDSQSLILASPFSTGELSFGSDAGVELHLLEARDSRYVSRRWRADKVDWTAEVLGKRSSEDPKASSFAMPAWPTHACWEEPVDVVYTWVDSSDPEWQAQRAKWSGDIETSVDHSASNDERYLDRDELRYSLRSLRMYAPFVRNIYIVTAGQRPAWLNEKQEGVHVVSHEEIFPETSVLPTFNSHAIEACLHRIDGLSEHFIYFNDDVFLNREMGPEDFFTKAGMMKSRFSPTSFASVSRPGDEAIPTDWASYNANRLLWRDFGVTFERKMKHVPMPLRRSVLCEIEQRYSEEVQATRVNRFRASTDLSIPSMFAHYYAIMTGRGVEWPNLPADYMYADTGRADFKKRLAKIRKSKPSFVCLNVTRYDDIDLSSQRNLLVDYMKSRYPIPSPFENGGA